MTRRPELGEEEVRPSGVLELGNGVDGLDVTEVGERRSSSVLRRRTDFNAGEPDIFGIG